jgi:hypothetical protein
MMTTEQREQPQWETIVAATSDEHAVTDRLPVPGGWVYRVMNRVSGAPALCFVPDKLAPQGASPPTTRLPSSRLRR